MSMKFEIVKNSDSFTGYDIPDCEYHGQISGLCCGWQFEFKNSNGELNYNLTPEEVRVILLEELSPKKSVIIEDEEEEKENENN